MCVPAVAIGINWSSSASLDFSRWCLTANPAVACDQLLVCFPGYSAGRDFDPAGGAPGEPQCKMTVLPLNSGKPRIGYPRMSASGESSTTMHRLLHASGSHPIPMPYDPNFSKTQTGNAYKPKFKAVKGQKNHWTTITKLSNSTTTSRSFNSSIQVSKLVSIERPRGYELSATNLAPNDDGNRLK
ncbi:hypothetical protein F511_13098 [Dorcoceras hygrometricum]|uniref:Uncharacterized protein n=1 Tax=Dorcoceras hygrometricum TaxID=472368 RepID=A0A2Z7AT87_9LAMI|nr:hypothetical protein F511_13098 [Dorcoceras hygrometricum]